MAFVPTLCEVTYDADTLERDRYRTPYRIPQLNTFGKTHCAGTIGRQPGNFGFDRLSVHSRNTAHSYCDYLKSYYLEQSCSPATYIGSIPSPSLLSRSQTTFAWCVPVSEDARPVGYRDDRREGLSLPALLKTPTHREERGELPQRERLMWVDALNSWVPLMALQKKSSPNDSADAISRKHNRKAYSTPLSNAESRRKHIVQFQRPLTPDTVPEAHPASQEAVQKAWASPDSLEREGEGNGEETTEVKEDEEEDVAERLEVPVSEAETRTVDSAPALDLEQGIVDSEEQRESDVVEINQPIPDKPHIRLTQPDGSHLLRQKQPKPPLRPPPVSKTKPHGKRISPRKPVISKPSKSTTKTSTAVPKVSKTPQQRQKPAKSTSKHKKDEGRPQPLPVSLPVVTAEPHLPSPSPSPSPTSPLENLLQPEDKDTKAKGRSQIKKRERIVKRRECKTEEVSTDTRIPEFQVANSDWIYGKEEPETQTEKQDVIDVKEEQSVLLPVVPDLPSTNSQSTINRIQKKLQAFRQPIDNKKRWGPKKRDTSYEDDLRKQELAETRRKRQADMLERLKKKRSEQIMNENGITGIPSFEDYGFLAKYCILTRANLEMYKHAFQAVDDEGRGWLNGTEAMIALRGTNTHLTETEEDYLYRIVELTGYNVNNGADFKLFSVLAALSQRIASLDLWMKNIIGRVDFKTLEMKMFMCKSLWECNVDPNTNKISLHQLMIELRAGGVSYEHECEVQQKLGHLKSFDLLDFLTYVPLFIMIHESVVDNPLDDTREK